MYHHPPTSINPTPSTRIQIVGVSTPACGIAEADAANGVGVGAAAGVAEAAGRSVAVAVEARGAEGVMVDAPTLSGVGVLVGGRVAVAGPFCAG